MLSVLLLIKLFMLFTPKDSADIPRSIYDFKVDALDGGKINFDDYRGKKVLVVNTASKCGYTPQYAALEKLYKANKEKLVIIGFPANNFGAQEPGTNEEISAFCQKNYGVTFPMAAKVSVKGDDMAPLYHWLTEKRYNGFQDSEIGWNFQKYLINEKGNLIAVFPSGIKPDAPEVMAELAK